MKYTLPALLAAALCSTTYLPAQAQRSAPPANGTTAAKSSSSDVVGSLNGQPLTWTEVIHTIQVESPELLSTSVSQVIGSQVANQLFGPTARAQVTITRAQALTALREQPTQQISQYVSNLLRAKAIHQEALKQHVAPTDAEVQAHITKLLNDARKQNFIPAGMTDAQFLASRNITQAFLRDRVRQDMETLALVGKSLEKTNGRPFGPNDFLQARHILIMTNEQTAFAVPKPGESTPGTKPEDKEKADKDAQAKITQIRNDIVSGKKTFDAEAKEFSQDPGTKDKGGDLGVFVRG